LEDDASDSDSEVDVDDIVTNRYFGRTPTPLTDGNTTDASRQAASSQLSSSSVSIPLELAEPSRPSQDSIIIIEEDLIGAQSSHSNQPALPDSYEARLLVPDLSTSQDSLRELMRSSRSSRRRSYYSVSLAKADSIESVVSRSQRSPRAAAPDVIENSLGEDLEVGWRAHKDKRTGRVFYAK
jgi:hypothetical protein